MRLLFLCAFATLAAASRNHPQLILLKSETPTTEYREEDSKGFYSYGYSSDDSAKAEYKTRDGSSKGFYSYVDSDGKLQTVKYEAGRRQGFTASATNLPTPPMDNSRAPEPVQDTPEVEMAKQAHFEAYREAAIKAAMQPDTGDDNGESDQINGSANEVNDSNGSAEVNLSAEQHSAQQLETELQQNTRELLMNQLKTVYRLDSSDSKVELKLGGLDVDSSQQRSLDLSQATQNQLSSEDTNLGTTFESIRVPSNSYYTVNNPDTHYTVETPTVLTTLPRLVSVSLGNHRLPISLSTAFSSQRLSSESTHSLEWISRMQLIIFITSLTALTMADSYYYPVPQKQLLTPLLLIKTQQKAPLQQQPQIEQYFSQDALGQYSYGYKEPLSSKQEVRTFDGVTTGSYSYIDANGLLQTVDYTADGDGFHVLATNLPKDRQNVPEPVQETAEVAKAREEHLAAHKAILEGNPTSSAILPKPVEDTTEVAEAKREFFARFAAEEEKHKLLQKSALLNNQHLILSNPTFKQAQFLAQDLKTKPAQTVITSVPGFKTSLIPGIGAITYGYQIGSAALKASRYYLPVA
ncbi:hypothetical protein DOY81_007074 [Sarcophaga bullata]|nr:hypothetical protein DOY81_007074 [Sarcophaga bullata]